ncbi:class I SAM-dependent methyltransferase [Streptomyces sp. SAI-127]|uniref:class I SAM-dependent methyltransferase n=1 Tax=Streptomyces sp. SAI-127 TaxID=2940543 RepID=UPI0024753CD5|nr:class I SAM-dependent methyltransferase [Streptomyces sp. SAI-127]MDH6488650.1 SAM-dependent methyltransferase [Streptomyces sp. SAI-127]
MDEQRYDVWASGAAYDRYMGRWSRAVAREFTAWLGRPDGLRWLDVGCGTGVLSAVVRERCRPDLVVGCDRSEGFVRAGRAGVVADAMALPVRDGAFDVAVSGLTLNFLPDPVAAVTAMARAVRPGGALVAGYVWDYADGMRLLRLFWDTAAELDPGAAELDEGLRFPGCRPQPLHDLWTTAGLVDVIVRAIEVPTVFADFADLWGPFLAGPGPRAGLCHQPPPGRPGRTARSSARGRPHRPRRFDPPLGTRLGRTRTNQVNQPVTCGPCDTSRPGYVSLNLWLRGGERATMGT